MERRFRLAGRLTAVFLALLLVQSACAQQTLAALAQEQGCTTHTLLDSGLLAAGDSVSDWIAIAAGRGNEDIQTEGYLEALSDYVTRKYRQEGGLDSVRATQWHRISLAILALGGDPTDVGKNHIDLIADGTYNWSATDSPGTQGLNGWIFSLIALDSARFAVAQDGRFSRDAMVTAILSAQEPDGGFGLAAGSSDVDITAMALQALAPYRNGTVIYELTDGRSTSVQASVDRALDWLSGQQTENGDFISWGNANAESTAQVIIALCALGIDPASDSRFCRGTVSAADGLLRYRLDNGMFAHVLSGGEDLMATEQAILAQEAMERLKSGARSLYDFRPPQKESIARQIEQLNLEIDVADGETLRTQADALYARYLAVPADERSYVWEFDALRKALNENNVTLEPDNPAKAYDLRAAAVSDGKDANRILYTAGAAAILLCGGLMARKRRQKCTK